jgi:RHS repeat-associated protein
MKSFAAMVSGHLISVLISVLVLGGNSTPAYAVTWNYIGPAFNVPQCDAATNNFSTGPHTCIDGNVTGSFTFPDSLVASGGVYISQFTSWTMTSPLGTLSSDNGDDARGLTIIFTNGQPTYWALQVVTPGYAYPSTPTGTSIYSSGALASGMYSDDTVYYTTSGGSFETIGYEAGAPGSWSGSTTSIAVTVDGKTLGVCHPGGASCGDPINVGTGSVFEAITDYETAGQNALAFRRYYNSLVSTASSASATSLGARWRSGYDRSLAITPATVTVTRADGQQLTFTLSGGTWVADSDVDMTLSQSGSSWTLTDHDDTVETYLTTGSGDAAILQSIQTRNGYLQTLSYNAGNQLVQVTDSYNRSLTLGYNGTSLVTVTTPDGLVLTYGYDSSGVTPGVADRLTSVSYSTNPVTMQTYLYELPSYPFALTGVTDENRQRYATWTYDQVGRGLSSQQGAGADLTTVSYDDTTGARTVTNALGQQDVYHFQPLQGVPKVQEIDRQATATTAAAQQLFTYDSNGYTATVTDWNAVLTRYTNDSRGDPTVIEEAVGTPAARTTTITYDPTFVHLPAEIVTPGVTTRFHYDPTGNVLTKTLIDTTTQTSPYTTNGQMRTWTYTWNNGLLASVKRPRTDVNGSTQFTYDSSGALIATTNALNQTTHVTQHLPGGLPQTIVDPNGVSTILAYDTRLRLLTSTTTSAALVTSFSYDPAGNLVGVMLPDGSTLVDGYDTAHRLTSVTDLFNQRIAYTLDGLGNRTLHQALDASSTVHQQHSGVFDALGRMLEDVGGASQARAYTYDNNGNPLTIADPLGHITQQAFDALNRLQQVTQAPPVGGTIVTTHDAHDRPLTVKDPNGNVTSYVYDGFGDLIQQTSPDSGTTVYNYDADGNLTQKKDGAHAVTTYTYDALDRVRTRTYPAHTAENVTYTYDEAGHGFGIGRLTSITDQPGALSRSYDERGNITNETRTTATAMLSTGYAYDGAGRVAAITYPSGWRVAYDRDTMGRVTGVSLTPPGSATSASVLSAASYEPFGPRNGLVFGNAVTETGAFDLDYRMTNLADTGTAALQDLTYGYDDADNVLSILDGVTPGSTQTFGYDVLNRLSSATGGYGTLGYGYDPVGNITTQTTAGVTRTYKYGANTNRLAEIDDGVIRQKIGTTAAGSIKTFKPAIGAVKKLLYNKANRLTTVKGKPGVVGRYSYDAFGQRLIKTAARTTLFAYDPSGQLLEETTGGAATDYIYLNGRPIAALTPSSGAVAFLLADRLGTPQRAVDSTQSTVWSANYQPFGVATIAASTTQNLRFPGQYADAESGLNQNGFRDYAPGLGRYLESDPIGLAGGLSSYAYVEGNPVSNIDPSGLYCRSAGAVTVCSYPGGPTFPIPTPPNFPASLGPSGFLYHSYHVPVPIGSADQTDVLRQLINHPAPGGSEPASTNGTANTATVSIAAVPVLNNPIVSYLTYDLKTGEPVVVNVTTGNSFWDLSPGYVARTVSNGILNTYGEGLAWQQAPSLWGDSLENYLDQKVWREQSATLISQSGCKH